MKRFFGFLALLVVCAPQEGWAQEVLFSPGTFPVYTLVRPSTNQALVVGRDSRALYVVNLSEAAPTHTEIRLDVDGDGNPFMDGDGQPIPVVSPLVVAVNEITGKAVVANYGSDNVSIVNLETQTTEAVIPVGAPGAGPRGVAIDSENNIAIITLLNGNSLELLDLDTNTPVLPAPIPVGANPISVAYDQKNDLALVATHGDASLQMVRYNLERKIATVVGSIFLGSGPLEVEISPELEIAAVAVGPGRAVAVLDTSGIPATLAGLVPLNTAPGSVAINSKTGLIAALLPETRTFSLMDPATLRKITTPSVFVGANPHHMSANPNNNTLLVANPPRDAVEIVSMGFINYFPLVSDTSQFRTNLGIRNLGEQEATVSISWGNQEGESSRERTATVGPRGFLQINHVLRFVRRASSVTDTSGSLRVISDQPFNSFISLIDNETQDPSLQVGVSQGSPKLLLSSSTNQGRFRTRLVIMNLGSLSAAARIRARDRETGEETGLIGGIQIPPNGFHVTDDVLGDLGLGSSSGPLEIDSATVQPLIAVALITSTERTGGFLVAAPVDLPLVTDE
jgi:YVTN family beta-propeller protein